MTASQTTNLYLSLVWLPMDANPKSFLTMVDQASLSARSADRPKQRRIGRACDYCHQRSIRCQPTGGGRPCKNCHQFDQPCTYHRKPRRRGAQSRATAESGTAVRQRQLTPQGTIAVSQSLPVEDSVASKKETQQHDSWHAPFIASQAVIMDLAELYFEIVYPIFPFFHQPSFLRRVSRAHYSTDKSFFAVTMAVCALVRSRVRDGAVTNSRWDVDALKQPGPEVFYNEAQRQAASFGITAKLNVLRAHAILAITAIQNGNIREMRWHLGTYQNLVAVDCLHDEANWPHGISVVEREERRRLVSTQAMPEAPAIPVITVGSTHKQYSPSFGPSTLWTYLLLLSVAESYAHEKRNLMSSTQRR